MRCGLLGGASVAHKQQRVHPARDYGNAAPRETSGPLFLVRLARTPPSSPRPPIPYGPGWGAKVYADVCSVIATGKIAGQSALAAIRAALNRPVAARSAARGVSSCLTPTMAVVGPVGDGINWYWIKMKNL